MRRRSNRGKYDLHIGEKEEILLGQSILPGDGFCGDAERERLVVERHLDDIVSWSLQSPEGYINDFGDPAPLGPGRRPALWWRYAAPDEPLKIGDGWESEAAYLSRHNLLTEQEKGNISPDAFDVMPFRPPFCEVRAVLFLNCLKHTKGRWSGVPFNLRLWQRGHIRELFGNIREDGLRQYRRCLWETPRKNGKSEIASGVALYLTIADDEPSAEVYGAAGDRDQALLAWNVAADMARMSPRLAERCTIRPSRYLITDKPSRSIYKAIAAAADLKHGLNPHGVLYDELHVAKNRALYDVFDTSFGSRTQPMFFMPTTAGWNRQSICWEVHEEAQAVLDGLIERPAFYPVIYAADEQSDWTDEKVWKAANPALGDFRSIDEMREKFNEALEMPSRENTFRQLYLNQWTQQAERWLPMDKWRACGVPLRDLTGRECYAAIDLSATTDLTAVTYLFPADDGTFDLAADFFLPDRDLKRAADRDRVPYEKWVDEGFLIATPGQVVDYDMVSDRICERGEGFDIVEIEFDPWQAAAIVKQLEEEGFTLNKMRQNYERMSPGAKHLERLLIQRALRHGGNPILEWMAGNVAVKRDAGDNIKPVKPHQTARIDGMTALVMSIAGYLKAPMREPEPYADHGLRFV